jgi:Holliday junction DNA helicase RuvA
VIEFVRGTMVRVSSDHVVVDVSGVGIRVEAAGPTVAGLHEGEQHQIPTALVVREDSWTLYGFGSEDEREVFQSVQTVSGIGPRTAQALIGSLSATGVRQAVAAADEKSLTKAPGIGRKGAQRMILELGDRLAPPAVSNSANGLDPAIPSQEQNWHGDVHSSLVSLGWSSREARDAMDVALAKLEVGPADALGELTVGEVMRAALRELNRS